MEKLILVFYVNIGNMAYSEIVEYMGTLRKELVQNDPEILEFFIPVRDQESKIECINPKLVSEELYKEVEEKLNKIKDEMDLCLSRLNEPK